MHLSVSNFKLKILNFKFAGGFTLIELLVVIAIIGILLAAATASYGVAQTKGRDGKRKADLKAVQQALEQYYQTNGKYPDTSGGKIMCNSTGDTTALDWGRTFVCSSITYIAPLPKDPAFDPSTNFDYYYTPVGAGNQKYMISARLENKNDPENTDNPAYVAGTLPCNNATYSGPTGGRTYCVINP